MRKCRDELALPLPEFPGTSYKEEIIEIRVSMLIVIANIT
jgi:hypothetical protein